MVLKRKRSDSEISSSSLLSSPLSFNFMDLDPALATRSMREFTPSHLSSRTRKRYRDNRPSQETIHQNTLSMMYSAQKQDPSPIISQEPQAPVATVHSQPLQSSLHSFWAIPSRPSTCASITASPSPTPTPQLSRTTNCDDCNTPLVSLSDDMDVDMMDIDVYANNMDYGCTGCCKQVCHQCSVSNLGEQRQCLICAGKRKWIGGLGWVDN